MSENAGHGQGGQGSRESSAAISGQAVEKGSDSMIRRRNMMIETLAASLLAGPAATLGQTLGRIHRVGVLGIARPGSRDHPRPDNPAIWPPYQEFLDELTRRGHIEGRNLILERRYADGDSGKLDRLAAELAALPLDVIFTHAGSAGARADLRVTNTTPIVMELAGDPVSAGPVSSSSTVATSTI